MHEMPCEGAFETDGYCAMCGVREKTSEDLQSGMPCGVWADLCQNKMGRFWSEGEPDVPRVANGIKNRVDRLKCLGNAVVPQQFYPIFKAIAEEMDR